MNITNGMAETKKRKLTATEISQILSFLAPNPELPFDVAQNIYEREYQKHEKQLQKIKIFPEVIPLLRDELQSQYETTMMEPGTSVGIICAQSIGKDQTQTNLNTFHKAGSADKQPITSKFAEVMNATKDQKNPICFVFLKNGNTSIQKVRETIGSDLVQITLGKITTSFKVNMEQKREKWHEIYELIEGKSIEFKACISIRVNMELLYTYKITLKTIADAVNNMYSDVLCVYSPDVLARLDIFLDSKNMEVPDDINGGDANMLAYYFRAVLFPSMQKKVLLGIYGVENIFFLREKETKEEKWMLEVENTREKLPDSVLRFKKILALSMVDATRTTANNSWIIFHTLGIEATREYMITELSSIMPSVNLCHIELLVDKMLANGTIASISRYSMRQEESGPLGKASFEETLDNFLTAAVFGQQEPATGVSASIICGKKIASGTGMCQLKMDLQSIAEDAE